MKKLFVLLLLTFISFTNAFACGGDEPNQYFNGSGFNLIKANDMILGVYEKMPIWAEKHCGSGISGNYKKGEETKQFSIVVTEDKTVEGTFGNTKLTIAALSAEEKQNNSK